MSLRGGSGPTGPLSSLCHFHIEANEHKIFLAGTTSVSKNGQSSSEDLLHTEGKCFPCEGAVLGEESLCPSQEAWAGSVAGSLPSQTVVTLGFGSSSR